MPPTDSNPAPQKKPIQVAKLLPPKAPPPKPRPKPKPADDGGFEVVDDEADTATSQAAATETGFDVVDDDPPPRPKKKKPKVVADDDDEPSAGWGGDGDDDDRPRKKKKKKRRDIAAPDDDLEKAVERDNTLMEWGVPGFLILLGMIMTVVAAIMISRQDKELGPVAGVGVLLVASVVYTLIMIPVTIVALMVIGGVMGIEYGTLTNAIRSLAAITILINGIYFLGGAFGFFGVFAAPAIASLITFALFMSLFKLDPAETWISLMGLNALAFIGKTLFFLIVMAMLAKGLGRGGNDAGPDDGPGFNAPAGKNFNGGGGFNGGRNNRPFDPGDNDDN